MERKKIRTDLTIYEDQKDMAKALGINLSELARKKFDEEMQTPSQIQNKIDSMKSQIEKLEKEKEVQKNRIQQEDSSEQLFFDNLANILRERQNTGSGYFTEEHLLNQMQNYKQKFKKKIEFNTLKEKIEEAKQRLENEESN